MGVINASKYVVDGWQLASAAHDRKHSAKPNVPSGFFQFTRLLAIAASQASLAASDYQRSLRRASKGIAFAALLAERPMRSRSRSVSGSMPSVRAITLAPSATVPPIVVMRLLLRSMPTNTWEYKTITIPGDTTGTWAKDNTAGLTLYMVLAAPFRRRRMRGQLETISARLEPSTALLQRLTFSASPASPSFPAPKPHPPRARRS